MSNKPPQGFGYPSKCWNCGYDLPVFSYGCPGCGADNTPIMGPGVDKTPQGKRAALKSKLKSDLEAAKRDALKRLRKKT